MDYFELDKAIENLEAVATLLRQLIARDEELAVLGLARVQSWESYEKAEPVLADFDSFLSELLRLTKAVDRETFERMRTLADQAKLSDTLSNIYVRLRLEFERPTRGEMVTALARTLSRLLRMRRRGLFSDANAEIPLHDALVSIHRISPLIKRTKEIWAHNYDPGDKVFDTARLEADVVIQFIENTILNIQASEISKDDKAYLLRYLESTKHELGLNTPSWKMVVGGLVVVATILSGISDAPGAFENVSKAIEYILGTSVQRRIPPQLLLPDASGGVTTYTFTTNNHRERLAKGHVDVFKRSSMTENEVNLGSQ